MPSSVFSSFKAFPVTEGNALNSQWSFDASFSADVSAGIYNPDFLYLYVTDVSAINVGPTIASPLVIPLFTNGRLTTSYLVDNNTRGITFPIQNGTKYQLMAQLIYTDASNSIHYSNSSQSEVMCSTIPQPPSNFVLTPYTNQFGIKLLTNDGPNSVPPSPISPFDGFGLLQGIFINYSDGNNIYSIFEQNDASNNIYSQEIFIDVSLNEYEVSLTSYNYDTSQQLINGNTVSWGGRSDITNSKLVNVDDTPGPVQNLNVYETMADYSYNIAMQSNFNYVSNTITWQLPNTGASNETITSYIIYRNDVSINSITPTSLYYIDSDSSLIVGQTYFYNVGAVNANGQGTLPDPVSMTAVIYPAQTNLVVDPSGSGGMAMKVTNVPNGFPLDNYTYDFSYNGTNTNYQASNPLRVDASNGTLYSVQSSTEVESVQKSGVYYTTSFWTPPVTFTPFNPVIPDPSNILVTPLDASSNPTGNVKVTWINSDVSGVGFTGNLTYTLQYKQTNSPDASYNTITNGTATSGAQSTYNVTAGLTLGKSYQFRVMNTLTGTGIDVGKVADSNYTTSTQVVPFLAPSAVQNPQLFNPVTTDMSYSWTAPANNGGLPITGYKSQLRILNDGSNNVVADASGNIDVSGNLATLFGQPLQSGSQYELIVNAIVDGSYNVQNQKFDGPESSAINFTVPTGLNNPSVANALNGNLLSGISISWDPSAIDASNATYKIYANGAANPLITGLTGTSYTDTSPTIGSWNSYQVVPVVNGVSAAYVPGSIPTKSNNIERLAYPAQPTNLNITNRTTADASFAWTASIGGSGNDASLNYLWTLTDASGNVDASGSTTNTFASASNLDSAQTYTLKVKTGVVNTANNQTYYNPNNIPELVFRLYGNIPKASIEQVYSSSGALLINLEEARDVSGVTFVNYKIDIASDASFNSIVKSYIGSASEYYASPLTDGNLYYIRAYYIYNDSISDVTSTVSDTKTGIPGPAPNQPSGVIANTQSPQSITVYWDIPNDNIMPNRYALNYGTEPSDLIPTIMNFKPLYDFSSNATHYYKQITGLSYGVTYYANVVAGIDMSGSTAVSQPSAVVTAVPYTAPSEPQNFANYSSSNSIQSNWTQPSTTGGAGQGNNSQLYYEVQLALDASFSQIVSDVSNVTSPYTFTGLAENTPYNARVKAYFFIQNNPSNLSTGPWQSQYDILTQPGPLPPSINVTANNTLQGGSQLGKTVIINCTTDPSFTANLTLKRAIYDPTGVTQLEALKPLNATALTTGPGTYRFTDQGTYAGDMSANFLNGNMMQYQVDVSYSIPNSSSPVYPLIAASKVAPFAAPIPTDASGNTISDVSNCIVPINPDASGGYTSFKMRINKNGSSINSLVAVGLLEPDGNVYVVQQTNPNIIYNNPQTDYKIAANQYGEYIVSYGPTNNVNNTLAVFSNAAGAEVYKQPSNGSFGSN